MSLERFDVSEEPIRCEVDRGIAYCSESCPQHDGKRCMLTGMRPNGVCEPWVSLLLQKVDEAEAAMRGLQNDLNEQVEFVALYGALEAACEHIRALYPAVDAAIEAVEERERKGRP